MREPRSDPPRFSSIASARAAARWRTRASLSPIVSSGTRVRRSAPSRRMPRSFSERSTAMPSASVALTSTISLSGSRAPTEGSASTPSSSICTPSMAPISSRASASQAERVAEQLLAALLHQRARAIDRAEEAGRGARRLEDVERGVQAVEVEVARVACQQQGPGVNEVSTLCVEIATASAPSASAEAGTPGWKPKCPAQAWSQISGIPARARARRCAPRARPRPARTVRRG